jgi:uncharacterized membrane protein
VSELVAVAFPDQARAAEVLEALRRLQRERLIRLEDACYVTKDAEGTIQLHQTLNPVAYGAVDGALRGVLVGLLFLMPLAGMLVGAAAGALIWPLIDLGISDRFVQQLAAELRPGSSALFVLVREPPADEDEVLRAVGSYGGTVLHTSLAPDAEARLQAALRAGGASET